MAKVQSFSPEINKALSRVVFDLALRLGLTLEEVCGSLEMLIDSAVKCGRPDAIVPTPDHLPGAVWAMHRRRVAMGVADGPEGMVALSRSGKLVKLTSGDPSGSGDRPH